MSEISSLDVHGITKLAEKLGPLPTHAVLGDLGRAAVTSKVIATAPYKKVLSFLLDEANGRDRREPWTSREGDVRPVPILRLSLEECFGMYADVHWFNLNKTTNASGKPLLGLFPRMGAMLGKVNVDTLAQVVVALLSDAPDAALLRVLQERGGRIPGIGVEIFSRLAFAHRRDLYFTVPRPWGETSGCLKYVGDDLRRYCELCRNLRTVCDELGFPAELRGSLLDHMLSLPHPPNALLESLHRAIGPSLARYSALEPSQAYEIPEHGEDLASLPMEFSAAALRARRGERTLRQSLLKAAGDRCALTGKCLRDLLEVAYVLPFPSGAVHVAERAFLLRSDVHALWDLNLLGVDAGTMRIYIAPRLEGTLYEKLAGRTMPDRDKGPALDRAALQERWRLFISAHPDAVGGAVAPEDGAREEEEASEGPTVVVRKRKRNRKKAREEADAGEQVQPDATLP